MWIPPWLKKIADYLPRDTRHHAKPAAQPIAPQPPEIKPPNVTRAPAGLFSPQASDPNQLIESLNRNATLQEEIRRIKSSLVTGDRITGYLVLSSPEHLQQAISLRDFCHRSTANIPEGKEATKEILSELLIRNGIVHRVLYSTAILEAKRLLAIQAQPECINPPTIEAGTKWKTSSGEKLQQVCEAVIKEELNPDINPIKFNKLVKEVSNLLAQSGEGSSINKHTVAHYLWDHYNLKITEVDKF